MTNHNPESGKLDSGDIEPVISDSIQGRRLWGVIPSGVVDIDVPRLVSDVNGEHLVTHCPEGISKGASYLLSLLNFGLIPPRRFRTECGNQYSCAECPKKPLQE